MSNLYREPSKEASYQVSIHLAKRFQRRRFFRFIWPSSFRGEDFFQKLTNQKRTFQGCFLPNFDSFGQAVTEKILQKSTNQKQELPVDAMFVNGSGRNEQSLQKTCHRCFLPSFGSFGKAVSEEKILKNRPIRNKNCLWQPCLLMDWDKMCNLQRGPSIDASYQVSVHLAEGFQRRSLNVKSLTNAGRQVMAKAHIAFDKVS